MPGLGRCVTTVRGRFSQRTMIARQSPERRNSPRRSTTLAAGSPIRSGITNACGDAEVDALGVVGALGTDEGVLDPSSVVAWQPVSMIMLASNAAGAYPRLECLQTRCFTRIRRVRGVDGLPQMGRRTALSHRASLDSACNCREACAFSIEMDVDPTSWMSVRGTPHGALPRQGRRRGCCTAGDRRCGDESGAPDVAALACGKARAPLETPGRACLKARALGAAKS